jgi:hypothetical protein
VPVEVAQNRNVVIGQFNARRLTSATKARV